MNGDLDTLTLDGNLLLTNGNIDEIDITYCICYDGCGHKQLIVEGGPQKCPNCGGDLFRLDRRRYRLIRK